MPLIRTNIKPEVMTSIVDMTMIAQVQRLAIIGRTKRAASVQKRSVAATVNTSPQSIGALYGMGVGVKLDICRANSFASLPLIILCKFIQSNSLILSLQVSEVVVERLGLSA